jgi:dephospho-CoA kinase
MTKIILGLVGPIASGKGTTCQYLKDKHNAEIFRFSTMLRDVLDRFYIEQNRENMQNLSSVLRKTFGEDLMAKTIANDVKKSQAQIIVLDGVRRQADIKYLLEMPEFKLVEINADQKVRYDRIIKRSENTDDAKKTFEQFKNDELQEPEMQIKEVAKTAKFHINNNGSLENLYNQIENILKQLS